MEERTRTRVIVLILDQDAEKLALKRGENGSSALHYYEVEGAFDPDKICQMRDQAAEQRVTAEVIALCGDNASSIRRVVGTMTSSKVTSGDVLYVFVAFVSADALPTADHLHTQALPLSQEVLATLPEKYRALISHALGRACKKAKVSDEHQDFCLDLL